MKNSTFLIVTLSLSSALAASEQSNAAQQFFSIAQLWSNAQALAQRTRSQEACDAEGDRRREMFDAWKRLQQPAQNPPNPEHALSAGFATLNISAESKNSHQS